MVRKIKKPLALFLALTMCLGMANITALAIDMDSHEHNTDGWACTQAEPVKILNCESEEHEHAEACYIPGESVLICEDESEEHEHGEECYIPGEPVLNCEQAEHTHDDGCYTFTEGGWTCVAPVVEETPAEVKTFLDAVAAIPAITAENAAEVAEYVYGPVSEAYEALLGTEYEERADVQEAVAAYAAAIEAVDAALDMYSSELASGYIPVESVGIYPDKKPTGNTATGKVRYSNQSLTMKVGQRASFLLGAPINELYHIYYGRKHTIAVYNPSDYCDISLIDNSGNNIVGNPTYAAGDNQGTRVFDTVFEALKPGVSNDVRVCYYTNFGIVFTNGANSAYISCPVCGAIILAYKDVTWYRYNDVFAITVNADYVLNLDPNGGTVSPTQLKQTVASTSATFSLPTPVWAGHTFKGWSDGINTYTGSYTLNWSEGYGSASNPVTGSLTAIWEEEGAPEAPTAPEREDLYGILGNFVQVKCVSEGEGLPHDAKTYCTNSYYSKDGKYESEVGAVYEDNGTYKVNVTLNGEVYADFYGFEPVYGTGVEHTLDADEAATKTVTLTWDAATQKWAGSEAKGTVLATFAVVCKKPTPPTPTNPSLTSLDKVRLTEAPAGVSLDLDGVTVNYDQNVLFVGDDAPAVTLLYRITVTGTEGARYKVTDEGAKWVGGDELTGIIAEGKTTAVIYVTKTFTKDDIEDGKLTNNATLESNGDSDNPTDGPEGDNGEGGDSTDAKKQYTVTINFKTDGENPTELQEPSKTTVDEGADFNYSVEQAKARTNSDVTAVVIPQRLGTNNEYVLDMVASAEGLDALSKAKNITADVVADIIYSLDERGTIGTDPETGDPTDTSDGIPDKYQVKVTFKVVNGSWNDGTRADVTVYVTKYKTVDEKQVMSTEGQGVLGDIIPPVSEKPDDTFKAGDWDVTPTAETTVAGDTVYTYTYVKDIVDPEPEEKITATWKSGYGENVTLKTRQYDKGTTTVPAGDYPADPVRNGYRFTGWSDPVIDEHGNITITAQWRSTGGGGGSTTTYYTLTINYVDEDGNVVATQYNKDHVSGYNYSVTSPTVEGMTPDQTVVSGRLTRDTTVTVTYTAEEDISEPDTPLVETPDTDPTKTPDEEDLGDTDVPLTETPNTDPEEELKDEEPPLAEVPQTGDDLTLWLALTLLSALGLCWLILTEKKGDKRIAR